MNPIKTKDLTWVLEAHTCDPSYSEANIRRIEIQSQVGQIVRENLSQKTHHKKGLVKWLKV
jgi:hypothetical protein